MTTKVCQLKNTLRWFTNGDFLPNFLTKHGL